MKNIQEKISKIINVTIMLAVIILGMNFVYAWNGPISNPPQGNAYSPINTTATSQTKLGSIWASGFFTTGGGYFGGDVGIGTSAPEARLDVRSGSCWYQFQTAGLFTNCSINTPIYLTISVDTANYNIATVLENPTTAKNVILTINSGVTVYSNNSATPSLDTGALPTGSTVKIVNNGTIFGAGGRGGDGGLNVTIAGAGYAGGTAINSGAQMTIDNTNGYIIGGGGGGGGGGGHPWCYSSGGGGGGAGYVGGGAGIGPCIQGAHNGIAGDTTGGNGGVGEYTSSCAGAGGKGGEYGEAGVDGENSCIGGGLPGLGGAPGKAVNLNSNSITWLGGNNGTQVKGAVQ